MRLANLIMKKYTFIETELIMLLEKVPEEAKKLYSLLYFQGHLVFFLKIYTNIISLFVLYHLKCTYM